jgi:CMP-2-keto-3-deoxyoctulosonic acid synthetase
MDVFFSRVDIPMGTNSTPLLANLFLYSYAADFIQEASQEKRKEANPIL